jgi:hypothetical protein
MARPKVFKATIVGSNRWIKAMNGMSRRLDDRINSALVKIGTGVSTAAKQRVPVGAKATGSRRPGALKQSIRFEIIRGKRIGAQVRIGTNIRYAPYIEFGTDRIARGRVKALGRSQLAAKDATAIRSWKSKTKRGQGVSGMPIMPFLRPAANMYARRARFWLSLALRKVSIESGFRTKTGGGA